MTSSHYTLLPLLLLLHIARAQNTTCPSGTFQTPKGICKTCPPATWREAKNPLIPTDRCVPCPRGTYNSFPGAHGRDLCRRCPPHTFASQPASVKCLPCPEGTISGRRATQCVVCRPGTELQTFSPKGCVPCKPGFYNPEKRNGRCRPCPDGKSSPSGATSITQCTVCPPGNGPDLYSGLCSLCIPGTFKPARSGLCESCPPGTVSNETRTGCMPCPPGTFKPILGNTCKECSPRFESRGFGNIRCRRIGKSCPKAYFEDAKRDCRACEKGFRFNIRESKCEKCPPGTISPGGVQAVCERCRGRQKPDSSQRVCECPRGHRKRRLGGCEPCPKGEFSRFPNERTSCSDCSPGTFSDKIGGTRCKPCPSGTTSFFRASQCTPCPPGTRNGEGHSSSNCVSVTTDCQPGYRRKLVGPTKQLFNCERVACKLNTDEEDIGRTCAPCDPNQFLDPKRRQCRDCPDNSISSGGLVTECQRCPNGMVQDPYEPSTCSCRAEGKGLQDEKCKPCPLGTFSDIKSEVCELCPPGKFTSEPGSRMCTPCPIDTIAAEEGAVRCKKCRKGTISNRRPRFGYNEDGGTKCINIPA